MLRPHGLTFSWCGAGLQAVASTSREPPGKQTSTVLSQGTSLPAAHLALQIQAGLNDMTLSNCQLFQHESMASAPGQGSFPRKLAIQSFIHDRFLGCGLWVFGEFGTPCLLLWLSGLCPSCEWASWTIWQPALEGDEVESSVVVLQHLAQRCLALNDSILGWGLQSL